MSLYRSYVVMIMVIAGLICLQFITADSELHSYQHKRQGSAKYCGKHLANTLNLVCHGFFNTMFKRLSSVQEMDPDDYRYSDEDSYPFNSRASAKAMMGRFGSGRFRRDSRGVHDECCAKPCSLNELLSYCGKPR